MPWEWTGRQSIVGEGGLIAVGDATVSPRALYTFEGEGVHPDASMRFEIRDGRPECVEIVVRAKPDGRGIRSGDVRMINIDTITIDVFHDLGTIGVTDEGAFYATRRAIQEARAQRRGTVTPEELADVAETYRKYPDAPTRAVEMLLGYSKRTAARRVKQAEEAGLLPPTDKGKKRV